jgi:hypothetical protein
MLPVTIDRIAILAKATCEVLALSWLNLWGLRPTVDAIGTCRYLGLKIWVRLADEKCRRVTSV